MKSSALIFSLCLAAMAHSSLADQPPSPTPSPEAINEARAACATDIQTLCSGVQPGGGRIFACLKEHKDKVSDGCKKAVQKATQNPS
jgi:Cysteine rich repeat